MTSKVVATAKNGILTEMIVQGETIDLCEIWSSLSVFVAKRVAKDLRHTTSRELTVMSASLMGLSEKIAKEEKE